MNWYALCVKSQHERVIAEQLRTDRLETYVPLYRSRRTWSDRVKVIDLPLFSRYVFCRFGFDQRLTVLRTPGVQKIVGFSGKPYPVDEQELETIRRIVGSGLPYSPWPNLRPGDPVRIREGALQGVEGTLEREKNGFRVIVKVELLNQGVAVEVERDMLERCPDLVERCPDRRVFAATA